MFEGPPQRLYFLEPNQNFLDYFIEEVATANGRYDPANVLVECGCDLHSVSSSWAVG
jgi:hypothetical protein